MIQTVAEPKELPDAILPSPYESFHVLGDHVELQVDLIPRGAIPEIGLREGVGHQPYFELVSVRAHDRQADAIEANGAFVDQVPAGAFGDGDPQYAGVTLLVYRPHESRAIDVPLNKVSTQTVHRPGRSFEIDPFAGR